jgi:hypothetical protein
MNVVERVLDSFLIKPQSFMMHSQEHAWNLFPRAIFVEERKPQLLINEAHSLEVFLGILRHFLEFEYLLGVLLLRDFCWLVLARISALEGY